MEFKFEKNVPNVYVDESRDFQLLCRILDIYLTGNQNRIADILNQLDLDISSESLLWAVANKQGFTTKKYFPPEVLRNVCRVFPYCIRNKGTIESIRVAALAVLSVDRLLSDIRVSLMQGEGTTESTGTYVYITCTVPGVYNSPYIEYLEEVLKFILPCGWGVTYGELSEIRAKPNESIQTESQSSAISLITARIMGNDTPFSYTADPSSGYSRYINAKYSVIGSAKIIRARSKEDLLDEVHFGDPNSPLTIGATGENSGDNVIYGNGIESTSHDKDEGYPPQGEVQQSE